MAWCRPGDKPLSEPMMVSLLTHKCVTRPQWVKPLHAKFFSGNKNIYVHFMALLHIDMTQVVQISPHIREGLTYSIYYFSQYHCCWWLGDARSNHDIYYVEPDWFGPRTVWVNALWRSTELIKKNRSDWNSWNISNIRSFHCRYVQNFPS